MRSSILVFSFLCVFLGSYASGAESEYFNVKGFSQGKMRKVAGIWSIYEQGEKLIVEENGKCTYNYRLIPCMWHGYIIEYETNAKTPVLKCKVYSDKPVNWGNPREVLVENQRFNEYELPLDRNETRFVNQQYVPTGSDLYRGIEIRTVCSFKDKEVLNFAQYFLHQPEEQTAEQKIAADQYKLGRVYALGQDVIKDLTLAYMWWHIAASKGNEDAIRGRDIIEELMTPVQVENALNLAIKCFEKNYKDC